MLATAVADAPLVSIIVPCYNAEAYVAETVDSALAQTHPRVEVLVLDDGSSDRSVEVLRRFGERIRLETGPNRGVNPTRRRGAELARGEFLQFLDADDLLLPRKLEACLAAFRDDVDVVFCGLESFGPGVRSTATPHGLGYRLLHAALRGSAQPDRYPWDPDRPLEFFVRTGIQTSQPLHRASFYRKTGGFRDDLAQCDDYEFHFRLALLGARFERIEPVLVRYRQHDSPDRIRHSERSASYVMRALTLMTQQAEGAGKLDPGVRAALAHRFALYARVFMRRGDPQHAARLYARARSLSRLPRSGGLAFDLLAAAVGIERAELAYHRLRGGESP